MSRDCTGIRIAVAEGMRCVLLLLVGSMSYAQSTGVLAGLATGSYFPLDVGDRWVYRIDDRNSTAQYQTWRIDRTVSYNGNTYSAMRIEGPGTFVYEEWFRADSAGRVYVLSGTGDQLFLDPGGQTAGAQLQVVSHGPAQAQGFGTFPDTLYYLNTLAGGLIQERGSLARGLGLLSSNAIMLSGSSGGTTQNRTLVEARVAGGITFPAAIPAVRLGIDHLSPDVTGKNVINCAVPCYFVACYLAGADPPDTYKPCAEVSVGLANWPSGASRAVELRLVSPDNTTLFDQLLMMADTPDSVTILRMPLYVAANAPYAPGTYQLSATTADGTAAAMLAVKIR
jgi:hypothetical protein